MRFETGIYDWLRRLLSSPADEMNRCQRSVKFGIDLARHCAGELRHDKATQMAAALTYHTLFSMLPMVVLLLITMNAFVGESDRELFKETVVQWFTRPLQADVGDAEAVGAEATDRLHDKAMQSAQDEAMQSAQIEAEVGDSTGGDMTLGQAQEAIGEKVQLVLDKLESIDLGKIGAIGLLIFIYAATGLLATIEHSFNTIFGFRQSRPWYMRLTIYYTSITLGPLVILAGLWLQSGFINTLQAGAWTNWLTAPFVVLSPLLTTWLVFFLLFVLLPSSQVRRRFAATGSFVSSILLLVAIEFFKVYVGHAATYSLYGALGLLPLFLLWLWINWIIVLFGLEITYTLQAMRGKQFKHSADKQTTQILVDYTVIVPLAGQIARAFGGGTLSKTDELSVEAGLPTWATEQMLSALEKAELIHKVEGMDRSGFTLARPADQITLKQVLDVGQSLTRSDMPDKNERDEKAGGQYTRQTQEQLHNHKNIDSATLADI